MFIVFLGDWVKIAGLWKQVVAIDPVSDSFSVLDADGNHIWYGTHVPEAFDALLSDSEMQDKLKKAGI